MKLEDFQNSSAGRVIKVWQAQPPYWAFTPNPLPPDLPFDIELINALSKADRALGELAGLGRTMPNPELLIRPFIRREAVLSSRIEGTQAGLAELYAYEAQQLALPNIKADAALADVREVLNYVHALEYGMERLKTLPVSLRLMRELHERLMAGVRGEHAAPGEFRRTQNWIGRPGCTLSDATYVPPPVDEMLHALDAFEKYLHSDDQNPPLIRLALIHYQFEAIHPFIDGNGRIGRLLISLLLINWNVLPLPLLYLSAYFERHRDAYYDRLLQVSRGGAWRDWIIYFMRGVAEQSRDAISRAKQIQDLQIEWRRQLQKKRVSGILSGIVDSLFETPMISATDVQARFGVTHPTAMRALRKLVELNVVQEVAGHERNRQYVAGDILRIAE